jgi:hypothetical protein
MTRFPNRSIFHRSPVVAGLVYSVAIWLAYSFIVLGLSLRDRYIAYSGIVVAKGRNAFVIPVIGSPERYLVVRDSSGQERRRYVSVTEYVMADSGSVIAKRRGFFEVAARPGQLPPGKLLDSLQRRNQRARSRLP